MRLLPACTTALALALVLAAGTTTGAERAYVPLEQRLSADQLRATGLDRLSRAQLELLNTLLRDEQAAHGKAVRTEVQAERQGRGGLFDSAGREPVVSTLKGDFRGWSGIQTFALDNGQTWRMVEPGDLYLRRALVRPKVTITPGLVGAWYLQVEGVPNRAKVTRIK